MQMILLNITVWYSVVVPFLPIEFDKIGLDVSIYGYIFAMYAFAVMIGSLIVGKLLTLLGRKFILIFGLGLMGVSMLAFGFITKIESHVILVIVWLVIRGLQGFSSSMIQTTSYSIVSIIFKDNQQKFLGYLESSMGVGLITGPVIGSALYTFFGFAYTFLGIGGVFIILAPILLFIIPKSVNVKDDWTNSYLSKRSFIEHTSLLVKRLEEISHSVIECNYISEEEGKSIPFYSNDENKNTKQVVKKEPIKYYRVFFRPIFFITSLATFLSYFWWCYIEPVMSLRLDEFNLSSFWIGVFFSISSLMYTISSLLISWFTSKINNKLLIFLGMFFNGISHFLVGPSPYLPDSLILMIVGQVLHGFSVTFFLITCLPVMINDAVEGYPKQKNEATDISSGIFNSMLGIGQMLGPIYGSNITNAFNFRLCADSVGAINIVYSVIFFITWKTCSKSEKNLKKSNNDKTKEKQLKD